MFVIKLDSPEFRALALALAEGARRRTRDDEDGAVSRSLARLLADHAAPVAAAGAVHLGLSAREGAVAESALLAAARGPLWYSERVGNARPGCEAFLGLASRIESARTLEA